MKIYTLIGLFAASMLVKGAQPPPVVVRYCSGCHESSGNAKLPYVPRLAGQRQAYLTARLDQFRHTPKPYVDELLHVHNRSDTSMIGIAHAVSAEELADAAQWYSSQRPAIRSMDRSIRGRDLYVNGLPSSDIPACAGCHETEVAPIIAGQNAAYLMEQLGLFRRGIRSNPGMSIVARNLTNADAQAVTAYLESIIKK